MAAVLTALLVVACRSSRDALIDALEERQTPIPEAVALTIAPDPEHSTATVDYFRLEEFDNSVFAMSESSEPLDIIDFGPRDELPVEIKRPTITVLFSQPMVPLARLGAPMTESPAMSVEPEIPGIYRWYGSRLLSFEPSDDLLSQREFTVTVSKDVRSLGGKGLPDSFAFTFRTEYLDIASYYPGRPQDVGYVDPNDVPPDPAKYVTISFTFPVNMEHVSQYLSVTADGRDYPFAATRPENAEGFLDEAFVGRSVVLEILDELPQDTDVIVTLEKGAASEPGYLGRPDPTERGYHTLRPFTFVRQSTYSWSFPRSEQGDANPLYLEFSHPVQQDDIHTHIEVDLSDDDLSDNVEAWGTTIKLNNLPVEYDSAYRVRIGAGLSDIYGRELESVQVVPVQVPSASRYAYFPNTGTRMLESQFPPKIIWEFQNVFDGVWRVDSIQDPYSSFSPDSLEPYDFSSAERNIKQYEILDLDPWLNDSGYGLVGLSWNFSERNERDERNRWSQRNLQVQVTDLGITTRYAYNRILVWVHSLTTNDPVVDATVTIRRENTAVMQSVTDESGFARFDLEPGVYQHHFRDDWYDRMRIAVTNGEDAAVFAPNGSHNPYAFGIYNTESPIRIEEERMETFIFTDRGLYRPGETVAFRGIDRTWSAGQYSVYTGPYLLGVKEQTYRAVPFVELQGDTSSSGGFYGSFVVPKDLAPGYYSIEYEREGKRTSISFQVAIFRRATFQVEVDPPSREFYLGEEIGFPVSATYLAGGSLSRATYNYYWAKTPVSYAPPGHEWRQYGFGPSQYGYQQSLSSGSGALSPVGETALRQRSTTEGVAGRPYRYQAEIRVQDIDRQEIAGAGSVIVHPASFYIGATLADAADTYWVGFLAAGEPATTRYAFVQPDGELAELSDISDPRVELIKHTWKVAQQRGVYGRINTRYELIDEVILAEELELAGPRGIWEFMPATAGRYTIRFSATDPADRPVITEISFYATGSEWVRWGGDNADEITLIPDRDSYQVGDTAKLLVQSPLPQGRYLVTIEREGIFDEKIIELSGSANLIDIPIEDAHVPVVYVAISSFNQRTAAPTTYFEPDLGKPKGFFGITTLSVSTEARTIDVEITPQSAVYGPGEEAEVEIRVTKGGRPLRNAEVTFLAVDRGVLDLINYHVPNPIDFFYAPYKFPLGVDGADSRSLLIDPVTYELTNLRGGDEEGKLQRREDFTPLAVFEPFVSTDRDGIAIVRFSLPDTLTTYRATAVVVNENEFGLSEHELLVQNPMNVRTALPRRLRLRDTSKAGVVITNLTDQQVEVSVELSVTGLAIEGNTIQETSVGPAESTEVVFTIVATARGEAELLFTIGSELLSEQLVAKLDVDRPLVTEAFTIAGRTDRDPQNPGVFVDLTRPGLAAAEEGLIIPAARVPDYGNLEVVLNTTRLAEITEAIRYLADYPFDYLDHRLTRILPQILFGELLDDLTNGEVPYTDGAVEEFFDEIGGFQNGDGGFSYNPRYYAWSSPYVSVKLAHYLRLALDSGHDVASLVDQEALLQYLVTLQSDERVSRYVRLFALYVRALYGHSVGSQLDDYKDLEDELGLSGYGFLGLAYAATGDPGSAVEMLDRIRQFIRVGTRGIDITEPYETRFYFDSQVSQISLAMLLYLQVDDSSEMLERLAYTLRLRQRYGHWVNTADTAWAAIAYGALVANEAGAETDMQVTVTVDNKTLLDAGFIGISAEPVVETYQFDDEPLASMKQNSLLPLSISKDGRGVAYYTATIRYALPSEVILPRDEGFSVVTQIETLSGDPVEGSVLELGETYRLRAAVSTTKARQMVALRIPVPSGVDILDASFVTTGSYGDQGGVNQRAWTRETVFGESETYVGEGTVAISPFGVVWDYYAPVQEIMDNEVRYFFDEFYPGFQEVTFLFRTTTPGIYPTPPAQVIAMYEEEVFGRTSGVLTIIE